MPHVGIVGFGYQGGLQLTRAGEALLGVSDWIGSLGLPSGALATWRSRNRVIQDVEEEVLGSPFGAACALPVPVDFAERVSSLVVARANALGRATLAVAGHPILMNPVFAVLVRYASQRGMSIAVAAGVSAFDNVSLATGLDLVRTGVQLYDARHFVALRPAVESRVPLLLLCAGYLSPEGASTQARAADLAALGDLLCAIYGRECPILHVRFADGEGAGLLLRVSPGALAAAEPPLDFLSTLLILPPQVQGWW